MLYEVITGVYPRSSLRVPAAPAGIGELSGGRGSAARGSQGGGPARFRGVGGREGLRITSYNVCYTKLLRVVFLPIS